MLHPSQVIVRIRNVDGLLADLGLNEVCDYTLKKRCHRVQDET